MRMHGLIALASLAVVSSAKASEPFPFGSEMMLEAAPMHGTKRMPMLEIDDDGATSIDLWCTSVQAQATVGADGTITIVPGATQPVQCTPERETVDQDLITALSQATGWRRNGDLVELSGATTLRFRLMTN
jgi:META domain-containing protein